MLLEVKVLCNFSLFLFWLFSHMNIYACKEDISCRNKGVFKTYVEWDYAAFSSSCASSFAILRPCFRTVAFSFLMSSKSSSIFKPSGRAAASTPFPFVDTCETKKMRRTASGDLTWSRCVRGRAENRWNSSIGFDKISVGWTVSRICCHLHHYRILVFALK